MKVFCENCISFEGTYSNFLNGRGEIAPIKQLIDAKCKHKKNIKIEVKEETWYGQTFKTTYNRTPQEINKNNKCKWYRQPTGHPTDCYI